MANETGEEKTRSPEPPPADKLSYKGSVSGLKGFLSNQITKIAGVVSPDSFPQTESGGRLIPVSQIYPNPDQPRQVFDPKGLEELAATMKEVGQAQAITVRVRGAGFEIISGERRFRAARLAGLTHLECVVKDVDDREAQLLSLVENLQRQDLLPIEEAHYLKKVLRENASLSLERLAKMLGTHKSTLSEKIQLTEMPQEEQTLLYAKGKSFTHRHWRVLSRIKDPSFLKTLLKKAIDEQLSVAELERALEAAGVPKAKRIPKMESDLKVKIFKSPFSFEGNALVVKSSKIRLDELSAHVKQELCVFLDDLKAKLQLT